MENDQLEEAVVVKAVEAIYQGESCRRDYILAHMPGWRLTELDGIPVVSRDTASTPTLTFTTTNVTGFTGCNRLSGSITTSGDTLRFGPIASTRRACRGTLESRFLNLLDAVDSYELLDHTLYLTSGMASVAVLEAIEESSSP
jgi:heat shock protein HslJ